MKTKMYRILVLENCIGLDEIKKLMDKRKVLDIKGCWIDYGTLSIVQYNSGQSNKVLLYPVSELINGGCLKRFYGLSRVLYLYLEEIPDWQSIFDLCFYVLVESFSFVIIKQQKDLVDALNEAIKQFTGQDLRVVSLKSNPFKG